MQDGPFITLVLASPKPIDFSRRYVQFFAFFALSDLDLWPSDLKFAHQLLVSIAIASPNFKFLRLSYFE